MTAQVYATLLGGAAVGAVLTAVVSLFTGWLSRRNEQRRWLLDKRLETYGLFNTALVDWRSAARDSAEAEAARARLRRLEFDLSLLAPRRTYNQTRVVMRSVGQNWPDKRELPRDIHALLNYQRQDVQGGKFIIHDVDFYWKESGGPAA